jgi:hypothetical protein
MQQDPSFNDDSNFGRDSINVVVGTIWQLTLVIMPIYLVVQQWWPMLGVFVLMALSTWFLKKNWLDKLEES